MPNRIKYRHIVSDYFANNMKIYPVKHYYQKLIYLFFTIGLLNFFISEKIIAQDLHFSQFYYSPLNLSPALTGIFNGDVRVNMNYRSQWKSVPANYETFSGGIDLKFYDKNFQNTLFSGGLLFNYDRAGDASLSLGSLALSGSLTQQLSENNFLTLGLQGSVGQRSFSLEQLTFDNQFNGDQFDPNLDSRESFQTTSKFFPSFSLGANWHFQIPDARTRLDAGVGYFHLNQPEVSFLGDPTILLPSRLSFFGMGSFKIASIADMVVRFQSHRQDEYKSLLLGGGIRLYLSEVKTRELSILIGGDVRLDDAIIPSVRFEYGSWAFGGSYDINNSDFERATRSRGGFEISVTYIYTQVKPLNIHKICPIF